MKKFILAFLALTIILSSCSIEKRIHTPGYHIKWNKSNQNFDRQNLTNNNDEKKSDENYFYTDEKKDSKSSKKELEANVSEPLSNLYSSIEKISHFNSAPRIEKKSSLSNEPLGLNKNEGPKEEAEKNLDKIVAILLIAMIIILIIGALWVLWAVLEILKIF